MDQRFPFSQFLKSTDKVGTTTNATATNSANNSVIENMQSSIKSNFLKPAKPLAKQANQTSPTKSTTRPPKIEATHANLDLRTPEFQKAMQAKMGQHAYCAYVENKVTLLSIDNGIIGLVVPGPFNKLMLEKHYGKELLETIQEIFGLDFTYEITLEGHQNHAPSANSMLTNIHNNLGQQEDSPDDLQIRIDSQVIDRLDRKHGPTIIDRSKGLENFVVGPSNNMAYAVCMTVSERPGGVYHSLYIQSSTGLGKTHLLHGIAGLIQNKRPELRVIMTNARDFMSEMMDAMAKKSIKDFRAKYSEKIDVLLIDDIHEIRNRPGTQNEIAHIFNEFVKNGKQLVFTSNRPPKEIEGLEDRVLTRLAGGLIVDIQKPDYETRIAIIKQKAKEEDLFFPTQVIQLLAQSFVDNIGELEGAIVRLAAFSNIMKVDIDLDVARDQLKINDELNNEKQLDIKKIAKIVADHFHIPLTDLRSQARFKTLVMPRHIAMYLAQKHLKITLVEIGEFFGNRDHSSVIHGTRKIQTMLEPSSELYFTIQDLEKLLKK